MTALYVRLLRMYPPSFRARFGEEMLQFVRDEAALGRRVSWLRTFADLFGSALVQRGRDGHMKVKLAAVAFIVLIVGGGTMLVTGAAASVSGGIFAAAVLAYLGLVFGISALVSRRSPGAEHDYVKPGKRWWWIVAAVLGMFQLVFMTGQLIEDPKAENVAALAVVSAFSALVFGGMIVRDRRVGNWMIAVGVLPMLPFIWVVLPPIASLLVIVMALSDNMRIAQAQPAA